MKTLFLYLGGIFASVFHPHIMPQQPPAVAPIINQVSAQSQKSAVSAVAVKTSTGNLNLDCQILAQKDADNHQASTGDESDVKQINYDGKKCWYELEYHMTGNEDTETEYEIKESPSTIAGGWLAFCEIVDSDPSDSLCEINGMGTIQEENYIGLEGVYFTKIVQ